MTLPPTLGDFETQAAELLEPGRLGYYSGGAGDEITLRDNVAAWGRWALRPRMMVDVSARDLRTTVLGREYAHPIFIAPTAFHGMAHPEAEVATARAAAATDSLFCLSSLATRSIAEVAEAAPGGRRWFQLYVFRDRGVTDAMVATAVEQGYEAIVLTVDLPAFGMRERDLRSGFAVTELVPNVDAAGGGGGLTPAEIAGLLDQSLTWKDVERFASASGLPVLVKGVLTPADARLAVDHGAAGVVVSNHGGRQLDTVLSGADALGPIADEVGGEVDVLVDGGIRRGTDVLKALAMGASAVMVGRPVLWGLACGGEDGVRHVLRLLQVSFENALMLAGVPVAAEADGSLVERAPWAGG